VVYKLLEKLDTWSKMIKVEHTLFSLPFVITSALLAIHYMQGLNDNFQVPWLTFWWIFVCLFGGRSAGMTLNRIIDSKIDAENPRTAGRAIPSGKLDVFTSYVLAAISIGLLILGAFKLPVICRILLPIAILWIWSYSYLKRFTWFCHVFLGATLGMATIGSWLAVTGSLNHAAPVYLGLAVLFWVAAFDIIYAFQDMDFDQKARLHSIPSRFGKHKALMVARFLHLMTVLSLYAVGVMLGLGLYYKLGLAMIMAALWYEQRLAKAGDINKAFFTINSWVSVIYMLCTILDLYIIKYV
jgi:4-hydroxybenzoate polyprenyltransferase